MEAVLNTILLEFHRLAEQSVLEGLSAKSPALRRAEAVASQVFAIACETGWSEDVILFMSLARLAQYQHCAMRRNAVRTRWSNDVGEHAAEPIGELLERYRLKWVESVEAGDS